MQYLTIWSKPHDFRYSNVHYRRLIPRVRSQSCHVQNLTFGSRMPSRGYYTCYSLKHTRYVAPSGRRQARLRNSCLTTLRPKVQLCRSFAEALPFRTLYGHALARVLSRTVAALSSFSRPPPHPLRAAPKFYSSNFQKLAKEGVEGGWWPRTSS